jgi:eukaryotic-like serine/threonine-protein kinase
VSTDLRDRLQATLGSAYTLEHELGGGGMSRVFAATETALGRKVVVKVLPPELAEGVSVERFKREIQLAARLQHPHIVPVLSAGEMSGLPYYMMPLVNGDSLRTRLPSGTPLPISQVVSILRDVAKALACGHESGVAHRDIKPENVLLTGGSAVVTDLGVAKALSVSKTLARGETLTQVGTSLGTSATAARTLAQTRVERRFHRLASPERGARVGAVCGSNRPRYAGWAPADARREAQIATSASPA